jgi:opacity protein-like surface antigen
MIVCAQKYPKPKEKATKNEDYYDSYYDDEERTKDIAWKQKGFELFIGGAAYFASKKTANYYNGATENDINLHLLMNNKYRKDEILNIMKEAYPYIDTITFAEDYNYNAGYNVAMDILLGAKYRFHRNWYIELSYSFRRLTSQSSFYFNFPGVPSSNINPPYSNMERLLAKEDRHYIDFSVGYILQINTIFKPFLSIGVQFTSIRLKSFDVFIEKEKYDLVAMAKDPGYTPGIDPMPSYMDWAGSGYGFSMTAGIKIAITPSVSLDPIFQLSLASFGHSKNLHNFNTDPCFNYIAGVRVVLNDAIFTKNR